MNLCDACGYDAGGVGELNPAHTTSQKKKKKKKKKKTAFGREWL